MPVLSNGQHERFCQEYHVRWLTGAAQKKARDEAYVAAGYACDQKYLSDNARKLTHKTAIRKRLDELRTRSAQLAELDAGWCLLQLKRRVELAAEFNVDDYLTPPLVPGASRFYDISRATREQLARLSELAVDEEVFDEGEKGERRVVRKIRVKGHTDIETPIGLIARIQGFAKPDKVSLTDPSGQNAVQPVMVNILRFSDAPAGHAAG